MYEVVRVEEGYGDYHSTFLENGHHQYTVEQYTEGDEVIVEDGIIIRRVDSDPPLDAQMQSTQ